MKKTIDIAQRLLPFSHIPGTSSLIPQTSYVATVFPGRLELVCLESKKTIEITLTDLGPLKEFTLLLDLEKERLIIFGSSLAGFVRYILYRQDNRLVLYFDRLPKEGIELRIQDEKTHCLEKESRVLDSELSECGPSKMKGRLSLGSHKKLDWDLVARRKNLQEILPVLYRLSQVAPHNNGVVPPLEKTNKLTTAPNLLEFVQAFFSGILVPRTFDDQFQGFNSECKTLTALDLLHQGSDHVRSLFFEESQDQIALLPNLPVEFHSGRFVGLETEHHDLIDIEWSKKCLKKVIIKARSDRTVLLSLQKQIKNFRMRTSLKDRGQEISFDKPIDLRTGSVIYLDRFQK